MQSGVDTCLNMVSERRERIGNLLVEAFYQPDRVSISQLHCDTCQFQFVEHGELKLTLRTRFLLQIFSSTVCSYNIPAKREKPAKKVRFNKLDLVGVLI